MGASHNSWLVTIGTLERLCRVTRESVGCLARRTVSVWVRFKLLGQTTIAVYETPDPSYARERRIVSTKKHEIHPSAIHLNSSASFSLCSSMKSRIDLLRSSMES